ncbi:hypothetical protein N7540_002341 [Penicillium herquei]|nr:hypothetical protein N7540_002341 [Penicillium herquei]
MIVIDNKNHRYTAAAPTRSLVIAISTKSLIDIANLKEQNYQKQHEQRAVLEQRGYPSWVIGRGHVRTSG